ncbi:hypothetical protein ACFC1T_08855 [Kitasatospora sp. NPDC056076]|uniref:hypothetical protein n=1 Tax=Kitasatospora sp. NPDC056076 TaxID=3345703 RepID=UPI0035D5C2CD
MSEPAPQTAADIARRILADIADGRTVDTDEHHPITPEQARVALGLDFEPTTRIDRPGQHRAPRADIILGAYADALGESTDPDASTWQAALRWACARFHDGAPTVQARADQDFTRKFGTTPWASLAARD